MVREARLRPPFSPQIRMAQHLELLLLGPPTLLADGAAVPVERRKAMALLAYLAMEPAPHARDLLAALLAPDDDPASARAGLRRALAVLAPTLRPWLRAEADRIALERDDGLSFDVARFRALRAGGTAAQLREAAACYQGDFMAGFSLPNSAPFEEWQFQHAEALRRELADTLERISRPEESQADPEAAIGYARRWAALNPLDESAHRRLMQLYAATGQTGAIERQYRVVRELLERELGAAPDPLTSELYEQLRRGERAPQGSRWSSAPPRLPAAPAVHDAGIEAPALPFLGREEELARIATALADPACRILTLIGPGGMGKTRLALQAAAENRPRFRDGATQVSLVGVSSADRMLTAIGAAVGATGAGDLLERIGAAIGERRLLLLLDNADQALDGAPLLRGLIHRAPNLKLLVTSRERLQLSEEWVIDLAGLAVPPADSDAVADYSAVRLFAQRARQVQGDFALTAEDLPHVAAICRMVEGMPLAIELAAAWVRVLTPAAIAQELEQSMSLLTTSLRDVPERHRSIEGVFAQSWERLSEAERSALQRLSVFDDGFTRAAAADVAGATPLILAGLADKALIRRDRQGRYTIHELLCQFAARKLAADPHEQHAAMLRFCRYAMRLLHQRNADLLGAHQRQALAELDAEYDNLWEAWSWAVAEQRIAELSEGLDGLYRLHELRGWYHDGIQALRMLVDRRPTAGDQHLAAEPSAGSDQRPGTNDQRRAPAPWPPALSAAAGSVVALTPSGPPSTRASDPSSPPQDEAVTLLLARARARLGALYCWIGQFQEAERELAAALPVLRAQQADLDVAAALISLGIVALEHDDDSEARALLDAGLSAYERLGHRPGIAWALDSLGDLSAIRGQYAQARELFNQSSAIYSGLGDQVNAAWSLTSLGRVLGLMGEHAAARQLLAESLEIFEALGEQQGDATAHANLAEIAFASGDLAGAQDHWLIALRGSHELGVPPLVIDVIVGLAGLLAAGGDHARAHALVAMALAHPSAWKETLNLAQGLAEQTAAALGPDAASEAARRGRTLTLEAAAEGLLAL